MKVTKEIKNKFFSRINKKDSHLIWKTKDLRFWYKWKTYISAKKASMLIHGYKINENEMVISKCSNKLCVNPDHLFIGTAKDRYNKLIESGFTHVKGYKMSENHKKIISDIHKGKNVSKKTRNKISASLKGKKENLSTKLKKSEAHKGEKNPSAKLTEKEALEIISLEGREGAMIIATRYKISKEQIYKIWNKKAWKHLSL